MRDVHAYHSHFVIQDISSAHYKMTGKYMSFHLTFTPRLRKSDIVDIFAIHH